MPRETSPLIETSLEPYVPWDKSWLMRVGVLDTFRGFDNTAAFLDEQDNLSDDLIALEEASKAWPNNEPVPVRESGTLYRFLIFASWKFGHDKEFITSGTLLDRPITQDPPIVNLSQRELLVLDNQTSQWASAAALCGDRERLDAEEYKLNSERYKLGLTYEAIDHWERLREQGLVWEPRKDPTIARQASTFRSLAHGETAHFIPRQAEDYCFAVEFGYLTPEEGLRRWPSLRGHESNRPVEMAAAMDQAGSGEIVSSRDHRVVQAIAMWGRLMDREVEFEHPDAVNKSWPEFWPFLESI